MATKKPNFFDTNIGKTVKVCAWASLSALVASLITATHDNPALFGSVTILVNTLLVLAQKTFFDSNTPNLGA